MAFGQKGPRALIAAVLGGPLADLGALVFGDRVKPILARFTAGQDVAGVELAGGATAVGFSAFAAQQVKRALDHRLGALEAAQGGGQGRVSAPELLAEFGQVSAQSESLICEEIQICKRKGRKE